MDVHFRAFWPEYSLPTFARKESARGGHSDRLSDHALRFPRTRQAAPRHGGRLEAPRRREGVLDAQSRLVHERQELRHHQRQDRQGPGADPGHGHRLEGAEVGQQSAVSSEHGPQALGDFLGQLQGVPGGRAGPVAFFGDDFDQEHGLTPIALSTQPSALSHAPPRTTLSPRRRLSASIARRQMASQVLVLQAGYTSTLTMASQSGNTKR